MQREMAAEWQLLIELTVFNSWPSGYNAEEMGTAGSSNSEVPLILLSLALL
jgi:hypothetical protein